MYSLHALKHCQLKHEEEKENQLYFYDYTFIHFKPMVRQMECSSGEIERLEIELLLRVYKKAGEARDKEISVQC